MAFNVYVRKKNGTPKHCKGRIKQDKKCMYV